MNNIEILLQNRIQDDYPIHHRSQIDFQSIFTQSQNRATIPLLSPTECATEYEDWHETITKNIEGAKFRAAQI